MSRRLALAALPLVLLVAPLAACTESARIPPAEPPPATQPLFASDEEALEAATAAYEEYLAASNAATAEPNSSRDELRTLVTAEHLIEIEQQIEQLKGEGFRTVGATVLRTVALQQHFEDSQGATVLVYVCLDVSGVRVFDDQGADRTPSDRDERVALEVEFATESERGEELLVAGSESWGESSPCS